MVIKNITSLVNDNPPAYSRTVTEKKPVPRGETSIHITQLNRDKTTSQGNAKTISLIILITITPLISILQLEANSCIDYAVNNLSLPFPYLSGGVGRRERHGIG